MTDAGNLDAWKNKMEKVRRILLEGVRDHIVSSLHGKGTPYKICKALTDLFQRKNYHRKFDVKDKLRKIKMEKGESISKYIKKILQCRDELGTVGIPFVADELVSLALLGFLIFGTVIKPLSMEGKILLIVNDCGWIWCRRSSNRALEMDLHLIMKMKKIVLWLPSQRRERGRNSIPSPSPRMERSRTCLG